LIILNFPEKGDATGSFDKVVGSMALHKDSAPDRKRQRSQRFAIPVVWSARGRPRSFPSPSEGSGAPGGANLPRVRGAAPSLAIGMLASRRSTCGSRHRLSPWLSSGPGFRGPGIGARLVQQAPCRAVLMPPDRGPGAARERGYKPRPQAPHPAPPLACLRRRPSESRTRNLWQAEGILSSRLQGKSISPPSS
jgi:hypothetical protein